MVFSTPSSPDNDAIRELRDEVKKLNKSTNSSSRAMFILTLAILLLTAVMVWQGFIK